MYIYFPAPQVSQLSCNEDSTLLPLLQNVHVYVVENSIESRSEYAPGPGFNVIIGHGHLLHVSVPIQ